MVVGGIVLPHPPILLSRFAGDRGAEVDGTIEAVRRACRWLAFGLRPGRLVIASPHLGHGFDVPLAFLEEVLGELPATDRLLTLDPYERYVELGRELRATEASVPIRTAIVASGDCSHRLRPDGPYGFHEAGPALDRAIQGGLRSRWRLCSPGRSKCCPMSAPTASATWSRLSVPKHRRSEQPSPAAWISLT